MKKIEQSLFLSPLLLLTSCQAATENSAYDELSAYLSSISFPTAYSSVNTIKEEKKETLYSLPTDGEEEELGSTSSLMLYDKTKEDDFYFYQKVTYSGTYITLDKDSSLYATEKVDKIFYSSEDSLYHIQRTYTGTSSKETSDLTSYTFPEKAYEPSFFPSAYLTDTFYKSEQDGAYTCVLYYADFFKQNLAAYTYMSMDNNVFQYKVENTPYRYMDSSSRLPKEQGEISETMKMDSLGMLISLEMIKNNRTDNQKVSSTDTCSYNVTIERQ